MPSARALALLVSLAVLAWMPAPLAARCRPSVGYRLSPILTTATAPGANVLLSLEHVYEARQAIATPASVTLRRSACTSHCTAHVTLQPLATNLVALPLPASLVPGRYLIVELQTSIDVAPVPAATAVTTAPVLAATPMGTIRVGTATTAPTIELASVAAGAVGVIARWGTSSWFMPIDGARTSMIFGRRRCSPPVPGRGAIAIGDAIELVYVDANGTASPATRITSAVALAD